MSGIAQSYEAIALCYKQGVLTAIVSLGLQQPQASVPKACCLLRARAPPSLSNAHCQDWERILDHSASYATCTKVRGSW